MNQQERLNYLVEAFKEDSGRYWHLETPADSEEKKVLLRSLMNIRMPRPLAPGVVAVQDAYLKERNLERKIVSLEEIPTVATLGSTTKHADQLSIWQGDITRLAVDTIVNAANAQMLGCFVPMHTCIDNCIHTFAGVQLRAECSRQMDLLRAKYGDCGFRGNKKRRFA